MSRIQTFKLYSYFQNFQIFGEGFDSSDRLSPHQSNGNVEEIRQVLLLLLNKASEQQDIHKLCLTYSTFLYISQRGWLT